MIRVTEYDGIAPAEAELRREAVYIAIVKLGAPTNKQIAAYLGWPINCVTGRTYELRREGRVVEGEKVIDRHTKKWVHTWVPKESEPTISEMEKVGRKPRTMQIVGSTTYAERFE